MRFNTIYLMTMATTFSVHAWGAEDIQVVNTKSAHYYQQPQYSLSSQTPGQYQQQVQNPQQPQVNRNFLLASLDGMSKTQLIRELFKFQQTEKIGKILSGQMAHALAQELPSHKQQALLDFMKKEVKIEELTELLVPIYDKNFSPTEIKVMILFYRSQAGQKLVASQETIFQSSNAVLETWAKKLDKQARKTLGISERQPASTR
jgi:uncharacterized protein